MSNKKILIMIKSKMLKAPRSTEKNIPLNAGAFAIIVDTSTKKKLMTINKNIMTTIANMNSHLLILK